MGDKISQKEDALSKEELCKAAELKREIRRKLSLLLSDPRTPEPFKDAFEDIGDDIWEI